MKVVKLLKKMMQPGFIAQFPLAGRKYKIVDTLGEGGFGVAYSARCTSDKSMVCIKFLEDQESWHREAYFGMLLRNNKNVVQLLESSPYKVEMGGISEMAYALVFEFCSNGSLYEYVHEKGPWPEKRVVREVKSLLKVLTELHAGGVLHRDITPMNVLVEAGGHLKLADFGIAGQQLPSAPLFASKFNPLFVSMRKLEGDSKWLEADDVYQMGVLMEFLLSKRFTGQTRVVKQLPCSTRTKDVILTAIGPRSKRYPSAYEMLIALKGDLSQQGQQVVRTLSNKNVVFTGPLSIRRDDALLLVLQKGGTVQAEVHTNTDILVIGERSPTYKHKIKGQKIKDAEKLIKKGYKIRMINETQFMRLVK